MVSTADPIFVETWSKEAHLKFQQGDSRLMGKFREEKSNNRKSHHFSVFDPVEATTGHTQHSDIEIQAHVTSDRRADMVIITQTLMIDDWDQAQTSVNYREAISNSIVGGMWRKFDDQAILELANTTSTEITLPTGNQLKMDGVNKMAETMDLLDIPMNDGNRYALLSAPAFTDLKNDSVFINNFHFQNEVIKTGMLQGAGGFDIYPSNRLPNGAAGATERRCFFWHKSAVGVAWAQPFKVNIDWNPMKQGFMFVGSMIVGFKIIEDAGVQFADITN